MSGTCRLKGAPGRITREDSIVLQADPETVFNVLVDLRSYKDWWPRSIRFAFDESGPVRVGTRMRVANQGAVAWVAEVTDIEPNRSIAFRYGEGAWEGTARWTLAPEANGVRVRYAIDIVPAPRWIRLLGRVVDLGAMHSKQMQGILENLKARVR